MYDGKPPPPSPWDGVCIFWDATTVDAVETSPMEVNRLFRRAGGVT